MISGISRFGARTLVGVDGGFYLGTADHAHGTRIYHLSSTYCDTGVTSAAGARVAAARAAPAAPQALMTDTQRHGTVLSWEPSATAARYEVMRSSYTNVPFTYKVPVTLPDGSLPEGSAPVPTKPGSPGSATMNLTLPGQYVPIGTTSSLYFVDRSRRPRVKYAYMVVAENARGTASTPSDVQVVPDPRPAPTFEQLENLLPFSGRASIAGGPQTRWRHGERAATLSELERMAHGESNEEDGMMAGRLARRLRYWGVAGGPAGG